VRTECASALPPNRRVQPTPLAASEIVAILKAEFVPNLVLIYWCGAADAQDVGRHPVRTQSHSRDAVDGDAIERQAVLACTLATSSR